MKTEDQERENLLKIQEFFQGECRAVDLSYSQNYLGAILELQAVIMKLPIKDHLKPEMEMIKTLLEGKDPLPHVKVSYISEHIIITNFNLNNIEGAKWACKLWEHLHGRIWEVGYSSGFLDPIKEEMEALTPMILGWAGELLMDIKDGLSKTRLGK